MILCEIYNARKLFISCFIWILRLNYCALENFVLGKVKKKKKKGNRVLAEIKVGLIKT